MLKEVLLYSGRIWLNKLDSLAGKAKNGRYYRKYRLINDNSFHTLTVFSDRVSNLFSLPETVVVKNLPVQASKYTVGEKEYQVFAVEYDELLKHIREDKAKA
jgi:hypothetical protein